MDEIIHPQNTLSRNAPPRLPDTACHDDRFRYAFISARPFAKDFRRYLIRALQSAGYPSLHVFLGRGAMEARFGDGLQKRVPLATLEDAASLIRHCFAAHPGVVMNAAGNSAPDIVLRLWTKLRGYTWIYDVYDWFLYDAAGLKLVQWWVTNHAYRLIASHCVVLSKDLVCRFPGAIHFENASHLVPSSRAKPFNHRVVVTAYYDRRTDFELLEDLARAAPDIALDLYGAVYNDDAPTVGAINRLTGRYSNVRYYGRFEFDDLQNILDEYAIGVVPYRATDLMTRFINPDKIFHYLCAGLEVITTPVPAVRHLDDYVHVAADAEGCLSAIRRITSLGERRNPGNLHELFNWDRRAQELSDFVARNSRTRRTRPRRIA